MKKLMVCAGEVSGDVHGSNLVRQLRAIDPDLMIFGMGSDLMRAAGADIRLDIVKTGTIGLTEVIKHLPATLFALKRMKKMIMDEKPNAILFIDSQGINMLLAQFAKSKGFRTIYYIAPQEWLWGTEKGIKNVIKANDLIIAIFKNEYDVYKKYGGNVEYYGHPLLDTIKTVMPKEDAFKKYGISASSPVLGLLPGSRTQEIEALTPILISTAKLILKKFPNAHFILPISSRHYKNMILKQIDKQLSITITDGGNYDIYNACDLLIASSGTVLLEASILGVPSVMIYKLSKVSEFIGKKILKIKFKYYCMPNILADKCVIPEYIQENCNPKTISNEVIEILKNKKSMNNIVEGMSYVKSMLGSPGAVKKAAQRIMQFML